MSTMFFLSIEDWEKITNIDEWIKECHIACDVPCIICDEMGHPFIRYKIHEDEYALLFKLKWMK